MQRSTHVMFRCALFAAGLSCAAVMAQSAPPAQSQQGAPMTQGTAELPPLPQAIQPSDAQLEKYAGASQKVALLAQKYRPKLEAAKDDGARRDIYQEADEKMIKVVKADGLTVDEFNGIGQAVQQNPQLQQRVQAMVGPGTAPAR